MNICFDNDVDTANTIQFDLLVFVLPPVTQGNKIRTASEELLVTLRQNRVRVKSLSQFPASVRFNPRVVVNCKTKLARIFRRELVFWGIWQFTYIVPQYRHRPCSGETRCLRIY